MPFVTGTPFLRTLAGATFVLSLALSAAAQSEIDIKKHTNGSDADLAPGPVILVGAPVTWTYVVTNTGSRPLTDILVTDDQGVTVTCPATELDAGASFTCTANGTAVAGQYANIGTVTALQPDETQVTDSDPSHYFGQAAPSLSIEKRTNGFDADTAPGPSLPAGSTVTWTYVVTNIGNDSLTGVGVTDDRGVSVSCPGTTLAAGESMTCTGSGTVQPGPYVNVGIAQATTPAQETVFAQDPSHHYGQMLLLVKRTNGVEVGGPPGPFLDPGSTVTWTYEVTNPGPAAVTSVAVTDDQGVSVACPSTTLAPGESMTCTGTGTAEPGPYANVGTATATLPLGGTVSGSDTSFYLGNALTIVKSTNGVDADALPGISVLSGSAVTWTYVVSNLGADALTNVTVTDDQGVSVTCPSTTLAAGASMTCTANGTATAGQYANVGTVEGTLPTLEVLSAADSSHYFGQTAALDFGDAPDPTYPSLFASNGARHVAGSTVFLGACVDGTAEAFQSAAATGDDLAPGLTFGTCATAGDDEDGVSFTSTLRVGYPGSVDVTASAPCTLSAWIDFNRDGDWGETADDLFPGGIALVAGANSLNFTIPAAATPGPSFARFRCTTGGAVGFDGQATDGEVEDYAVAIILPVPAVQATKDDALLADADSDGNADPGDTLRYTIVITNTGNGDATSVVFSDTPDPNTALVVGSVTTSAGAVTAGNTAGDTSVTVAAGTLPAFGGSVTITFDAVIGSLLPSGVTEVSNQGSVTGTNISTIATNAVVTPIQRTPIVSAVKTAVLQDDGTTIRYTIVVTNSGNGDATGVVFDDTLDPNTTLVTGSVVTSLGTVTTGNTAGDTSVAVDLGTLLVGEPATITFDARVISLPPGSTTITNQGSVSGANFGPVTTNATATSVTTAAFVAIPAAGTWALLVLLAAVAALGALRLTGRP